MIEIRIIGSFIAIDNREKSRDCPSSSNNPVVLDNRRSDNRDLTVLQNLNFAREYMAENKTIQDKDLDMPCKHKIIEV